MYKTFIRASSLTVIVLGLLELILGGNNAHAVLGFYIPNLRCSLKQNQFISEINFNRNPNRFDKKGFLGAVSNYVVGASGDKRMISSQSFKSVISKHQNMIIGTLGDELSTTGSFTLVNLSTGITGMWRYSATDIAGTITSQDFKCIYSTANPKQQR